MTDEPYDHDANDLMPMVDAYMAGDFTAFDEGGFDEIRDERAKEMARHLMILAALTGSNDQLRDLGEVRLGEIATEAQDAMKRLRAVSRATWALVASSDEEQVPLIFHPELVMIARCRLLNVSWARISDMVNMTPSGAFKRYSENVEALIDKQAKES